MPTLFRHRLLLSVVGVASILVGSVVILTVEASTLTRSFAVLSVVGFVLLAAALALMLLGGRWAADHPSRTVTAPVRGRWLALNSPATKVPSHGVRDYGQSHAIDLVADPEEFPRPEFGRGPGMRPPQDYPAFGEPVLSVVDGTVVAVHDGKRDHLSRTSVAALAVMGLEGVVRSLAGPGWVVGNHVTVRTPDGVFALVAHLRRGSARVAVGDPVLAGQQLGECGNTGNSSEPHVHVQLMDRASLWTAQGVPLEFAGIRIAAGSVTGERRDGVPGDGEHLLAG